MKKVAVVVTAVLVFTFLVAPTFAQTSTPRGKGIKEEVRQKIEEKRQEQIQRLSEVRKGRIRAYFARMVTRIEAVIKRIEKLIERIETRIAKIKEAGQDVSGFEKEVTKAKELVTGAKADLDTLKNSLEESLTSATPKDAFKDVISGVQDIKKKLIEAHRILVHLIGDIKGLRRPLPTQTP